jgi:pimeloyl-ACP methyl ester carboxylesterase
VVAPATRSGQPGAKLAGEHGRAAAAAPRRGDFTGDDLLLRAQLEPAQRGPLLNFSLQDGCRRRRAFPGRHDVDRLSRTERARVRQTYTAPSPASRAPPTTHRASALRVVDRIRVPALIITADDDPFVPAGSFGDPALLANPCIDVTLTRHGGHCGFLAPPTGLDDGYWAETQVVKMAKRVCDNHAPVSQ